MFSEKMKFLRHQKGVTQQEAANSLGITLRTVQNYEMGACLPKRRETIQKIAAYYSVPVGALISNSDCYIFESGRNEESGPKECDAEHMLSLLSDMSALFAGGRLSSEDRDLVMKTLNQLYWESRAFSAAGSVPAAEPVPAAGSASAAPDDDRAE